MTGEARERSFDALARGLASGDMSRRRALRLMGAALVGGTLASLGIGEAAADQCKPEGKACKKHTQCCSGNCSGGTCACQPNEGTCTGDSQCCSGNCDDEFSVCLPPTGPDLVMCECNDSTTITRCSSIDCFSGAQLVSVCAAVCASHGGARVRGCSLGACSG